MNIDKLFASIGDNLSQFKELITDNLTPKEAWRRLSTRRGSIVKEASKSIFEFPLIVSDSCDFDLAQKMAIAQEFRCAVYTKIVIERVGLIRLNAGENKEDLIDRVRGTINEEFSDAENYARSLVNSVNIKEDSGLNMRTIDGGIILETDNDDRPSSFEQEKGRIKAQLYYSEELLGKVKKEQEELQKIKDTSSRKFSDLDYRRTKRLKEIEHELSKERIQLQADLQAANARAISRSQTRGQYDAKFDPKYMELERIAKEGEARASKLGQIEAELEKRDDLVAMQHDLALGRKVGEYEAERQYKAKQAEERSNVGSTWSEIEKKFNKAEPTRISCEVEYATEAEVNIVKFTLGVKSYIRTIPSEEVVQFLPRAKFDRNRLIRLAKVTTGEIAFFKDFILGIDLAKQNYNSKEHGKDKWYTRLKNFSSESQVKRLVKADAMPTMTICVSMEDVDEILRVTKGKSDFRKKSEAKRLLDALGLMGFIILDGANDKIWWIEDADTDFAYYSPNQLVDSNKGVSERDLLNAIIAVNK